MCFPYLLILSSIWTNSYVENAVAQDTSEWDAPQKLAESLHPRSPLSVQLAAVEALARLPEERTSELLLSTWTRHGPRVHTAVVSVLVWREPWLGALDEEAEKRLELAASLDWARRDIAIRHPLASVRSRARSLLKERTPKPAIQQSLDRFQPALGMRGDAARGRAVFEEATCAKCHKVGTLGRDIGGPDLTRLIDKSPRSLLVHTIDPNRVVDHRFLEYTALTVEGRIVAGLMFDETEDCITLADGNDEFTIRRADLDELISHSLSQMPEHLVTSLTLRQMADMLAFLAGAEAQ
jgi:putative heme-binding domain-containing protein